MSWESRETIYGLGGVGGFSRESVTEASRGGEGPPRFERHVIYGRSLSELYYSEVAYISISHFLWKMGIFQNNHES